MNTRGIVIQKLKELLRDHEAQIKTRGCVHFRNLLLDTLAPIVESHFAVIMAKLCINGFAASIVAEPDKFND